MTEEIEEVEVEILPNNECKDLVFTGEIIDEDPMEEILNEADEENSKRIAEDHYNGGASFSACHEGICGHGRHGGAFW